MNKKFIITSIFIIILIITVTIFFVTNRKKDETSVEKFSSDEQIQEEQNKTDSIQTNKTNNSIGSDNLNNQSKEIKINLIVNNKTFSATLNDNETVRQLISEFPMTLQMSDLHSNEKYNYLDSSFTINSSIPRTINAGDIKLYGDNCLVIFYKSFSNSYSYTDLGKIDNIDEFVSELSKGNVTITFELAN